MLLYLLTLVGLQVQAQSSSQTVTSPLGPVVNLGYAAFAGNTTSPSGIQDGPVTFFGNIPYAEAPTGNLRFRAPKALDETPVSRGQLKVEDARNWGPACVQQPAVVGIGSEDCLKLNIWKPSNATEDSKLPVVVYIHGGGFVAGSPQGFPLYDWVAKSAGPIIGVSIAYRMSLLGFLAGSSVSADGDLNAGLLDQRAALEWVQRHIVKFGGDPENVGIAGESAGGAAVVMQMVAFAGQKKVPFRRAMAHSIGFGPMPNASLIAETFKNVASAAGCSTTGQSVMECLRGASIGAIVSAINHIPAGHLSPIVEGPSGFLPDLPSQLLSTGKFAPVEFMGGHCTNDGRTFVGGRPEQFQTEADVRRLVFSRWPGVSNNTINKALQLYPSPEEPGSPFTTQYDRAWTMAQDIIFGCMDWLTADRLTTKGERNVFSFRWNAPDAVLFAANPFQGVMHTSDLYFLFDGTKYAMAHTVLSLSTECRDSSGPNALSTFTPFNASEATLSNEAIAYWTSFTSSGDPSTQRGPSRITWNRFNGKGGASARIVPTRGDSSLTATKMEKYPAAEIQRCRFWMGADVVSETRV
ncbi:hypothetical protein HGRIS_000627 [Hohenbuehelia grisea]|uniref:Carboxylic ester hydrolase n=1 Tax=Hohenbuehelia grisea TaxID=104357 RepID=A0ABR3JTN2_9AGAR